VRLVLDRERRLALAISRRVRREGASQRPRQPGGPRLL
jgi:hypothetical protein